VPIYAERLGSVAVLTLDRPERRNALDRATCADLAAAVSAAAASEARVLVLAGAGPHFCAGADLSGVEDVSFVTALRATLDALASAPLPTIAAVQGAALGAGTQLALACDLRVAEPEARFGIPAGRLGLMVDHWTVRRLVQTAGDGPARAMLLAAAELDGHDAHRLGLVALETALSWAAEIATLAPLTLAGHKLSLNTADRAVPDAAAVEAFERAWASHDLVEGMTARAAKRPPEFRGR
jgi:enoyl-CoA hydratase